MSTTASPRRCRRTPRPLSPGALRPTDLLAAFFLAGIAFLVAGGVAAALDTAGALPWWGHWLALHLALVGGVSLLVLGAAQFFSTAFLATDPPARALVRAQLALWCTSTVLVAVGVPAGDSALSDLGGAGIIATLALFGAALWRLERRSLQRARWAVRWYHLSAGWLAIGALAGILMARGTAWPYGSLLGAHLALNLAGWLGTAIVGTLHTLYPSLTQTALRHPRLQGPTFAVWALAVAALAVGAAFGWPAVLVLGWGALAVGAGLLAVSVAGCARAATPPLSLAARMVGVAQGFLVAGLLYALGVLAADGPDAVLAGRPRSVLAALLLAGWIGMTVAGSLLHLLSVLRRVRHLGGAMPAPSPGRDRALTAAAAAAVAALAAGRAAGIDALGAAGRVVLIAVAALVAARVLVLAARAVRAVRLRV